jgi:hypothetical protein
MIPLGRTSKSYVAAVEMTTTNATREGQIKMAKEKIAIAAKYSKCELFNTFLRSRC